MATDPALFSRFDPDLALGSIVELSDLAAAVDAPCMSSPKKMHPHEKDKAGNAEAKRVCGPCPIRDVCLATAIVQRERYGVWGGASELERAAIRRAMDGKDPLGSAAPQEANLLDLMEAMAG